MKGNDVSHPPSETGPRRSILGKGSPWNAVVNHGALRQEVTAFSHSIEEGGKLGEDKSKSPSRRQGMTWWSLSK